MDTASDFLKEMAETYLKERRKECDLFSESLVEFLKNLRVHSELDECGNPVTYLVHSPTLEMLRLGKLSAIQPLFDPLMQLYLYLEENFGEDAHRRDAVEECPKEEGGLN